MPLQVVPNFETKLNGVINNSVTAISVDTNISGYTASESDPIALLCDSEVMHLTANPSGSWTVKREQEGTTAAAHADDAPVYAIISGETLLGLRERRNYLINGGFNVNQEFPGAQNVQNDDTYFHDQWVFLTEANADAKVENELTTIPAGAEAAAEVTILVTNKKAGYVQFLTGSRSASLIKSAGGRVSLQFKARQGVGTSISNLKAAILSWTSTKDVLTSDVVSVWGATGVTPTFATNWTAENTPAALAINNSGFILFKIENILLDAASAKNIAVFIWNDDSGVTANDSFIIGDVKLEPGPICTEYIGKSREEEIQDCKVFYQKSFEYATAPAQNAGLAGAEIFPSTAVGSVTLTTQTLLFGVSTRVIPATTSYNAGAANAQARNYTRSADFTGTTLDLQSEHGFRLQGAGPASTQLGDHCAYHWTANARL